MVIETKYKKQSSELIDEYIYRICRNKDVGIYNLNWSEVGEILNQELDEEYTESKYRKEYQAMQRGIDMVAEKNAAVEDLTEELDRKRDELYIQQVKTRDKLREYRKTLRDEARVENIIDIFKECAANISNVKPLQVESYPSSNGDKVAILQMSDIHYGEIVDDFINTYNTDVFYKRMGKLTAQVINYCKLMEVDSLKVLNLGDLVSGNIHVSTRVNAEEDVVEQTMVIAEVVAEMLTEFAKEIFNVEFYSVTDNHSRINKNYKEHIEKESFSRFIPWFIKERVSSIENIKVIENKINEVKEFELGMLDIFHEKAFFVHGHRDKIATMIPDLTLMTKIFPIAVFTGHLHKNYEDEVHGIDLIMNPSAIGSGEYAKSIRKTSKPRQKMTVYENNNGDVKRVATFLINL